MKELFPNMRKKKLKHLLNEDVLDKLKIKDKVFEMCANHFYIKKEIQENLEFVDDINADSLDLVEFIMKIEDEFGVTIPDENFPNIKTIGNLINYIYEELK